MLGWFLLFILIISIAQWLEKSVEYIGSSKSELEWAKLVIFLAGAILLFFAH